MKIGIFSKGRTPKHVRFYFKNEELEIAYNYKYLGIIFSRCGSFIDAKKHIAEQRDKALFVLLKSRQLHLPLDIQIDLFEKTIKPILVHGCEV